MDLDKLLARAKRRQALPLPAECRQLRVRVGISQAELAAVVGVTAPTLSRWETGARKPYGWMRDSYLAALDRIRADQ
jgi:DNA-binding transcriptional regulator YiaG